MPAERVAMRQAREIVRLKFSAGVATREIARRLGVAYSCGVGRLYAEDLMVKIEGPAGTMIVSV